MSTENKINPFTDEARKNNRKWLLKGPNERRYYIRYITADRWNVGGGRNNGGFILSTAKDVIIGPYCRHQKVESEIIDALTHPNTVPGTTEIIEFEGGIEAVPVNPSFGRLVLTDQEKI